MSSNSDKTKIKGVLPYLSQIGEFGDIDCTIFRGQRKANWDLEPKLFRPFIFSIKKNNIKKIRSDIEQAELRRLEHFKRYAVAYIDKNYHTHINTFYIFSNGSIESTGEERVFLDSYSNDKNRPRLIKINDTIFAIAYWTEISSKIHKGEGFNS